MKINYQDNVGAAKTATIGALNGLKELLSRELPLVERDLTTLAEMKAPDPRDYLRQRDAVQNPKGEIADIHSDLKWILRTLAETEALIKENRALVNELLK